MKMMKKFLVLMLAPLAFVACTGQDDVVAPTPTPTDPVLNEEAVVVNLAQQPDYIIYSSNYNNTFASSFGTRAGEDNGGKTYNNGVFGYYKLVDYQQGQSQEQVNQMPEAIKDNYECYPAAITAEEVAHVIKYIKDHPNEGGVSFTEKNYFMQNIGSSNDIYGNADGYTVFDDNMSDHNGAKHNSEKSGTKMNYLFVNTGVQPTHFNDYNATSGPDVLVINAPINDPTYNDSWGDYDNVKHDAWKMYNITYNEKTATYLCFDYRTKKNDGSFHDGDGVYNDWVIKLTPANGKPVVPPVDPDPDPDPTRQNVNGEIEVNLSMNAEKERWDYIETKTSIHVRALTDVEVFIPVPVEYYCDADDMSIVLDHKADNHIYYNNTENKNSYTQTINGVEITLNVSFSAAGITISTDGISAGLLNYCGTNFNDGITFEVYNYFNEKLSRDELQAYLDQSTVKFLDNDPKTYVNAFNKLLNYTDEVYSTVDETTGVWTPYKDRECTQILESDYWSRYTTTEDPSQRYFYLTSYKNTLDCVVKPFDTAYTKKFEGEGKDNRNFNVYYEKW